jgi:hypothetical protein
MFLYNAEPIVDVISNVHHNKTNGCSCQRVAASMKVFAIG